VQAGGLDSSCAVNGFGIEPDLDDRFSCAWCEVRYRRLSHEELTNEMMEQATRFGLSRSGQAGKFLT